MDLLLAAGDTLDIVLEGGWRRPATVTAVDAPHVDLEFPGPAATLPADLGWCTAQLEWTTADGTPTSTYGIVHAVDSVLRLEVTGGTGIVQQREHQRFRASVDVRISDGDRELAARTVDLSAGGMLVGDAAELHPGQAIHFDLHLDGVTVSGTGTVVRAAADGARGVRFDDRSRAIDECVSRLSGADSLSAA